MATTNTSQQASVTYDQFWKIERAQIGLHVANTIATGIVSDPYKLNPNYTPPAVI